MRTTVGFLVAVFGLAGAASAQQVGGNGLTEPDFQGRVRLGMSVPANALDAAVASEPARLGAARVFGDYYFLRSALPAGEASGFRATSGLLFGSRAGTWGGPDFAAPGGGFSVDTQRFSLLGASAAPDGTDGGAVPYLGLGYSGWSMKGGWSFSADLGLIALNPGSAVRFGRSLGGGQTLDETLRDMRLSPMLQLGVSYWWF